jgi:RimJ/RimL family protein N-acetyltransferase
MIGSELELRPATAQDRDQVLEWRNHPTIVALGSTQQTVAPSEHAAWFAGTLRSSDSLLLIVEIDRSPAGTVRFDRRSESCVISVYLAPPMIGRGFGTQAIRRACELARARWPAVPILAHVRATNHRAISAFTNAGFSAATEAQPAEGHLTFAYPGLSRA